MTRLLLAEDERALSRAVSVILEKGGFVVELAFDGNETLNKLSSDSFDGVVMDIMMPGMDGISVLKKIRSRGDLTPVLLLTAKSEIDDRVEGLDSGANDYLTKPFAAKELLARVRAMTHLQAAQTSTRLFMGNVCLDRGTNEISTPTGSFRLSVKEMLMLDLMLLSPEHVISCERFIERVWNGEDVEKSVVRIYASYLRQKLESLNANLELKFTDDEKYGLFLMKTAE